MRQFRFVHLGVVLALTASTAMAVTLINDVGAAGSATPSLFVPIVPCRLADTRPGTGDIGPRRTPIGTNEVVQFAVWGTNGQCTIPNTATGIATNVTAVGPTSDGYLTVFPADAASRPTASNLNFSAGQAPTPNQVTVGLSASGAIAVFNERGAVNIIIDIVGYYVPSTGGGTGPPGPPGAPAPTPQDVIWVAKSGGQFTSVSAAMNSITDGGPHLINVAPGTYVETAPIVMKNNVDLAGSGQDRTTITCACGSGYSGSTVLAYGKISAEIRDITITNSGGLASGSIALELKYVNAEFSVVDTTLTATGSSFAIALKISDYSDHPHIDNINTYTTGATSNFGIYTEGDSVTIRNSWIYISGPGNSVYDHGFRILLVDSMVFGATQNLVNRCVNVFDINNAPYPCT